MGKDEQKKNEMHRTNLLLCYPQGQTWQKHQYDDSKICEKNYTEKKRELWEELKRDNTT